MADIHLLTPKILQWEGGFVNDPKDLGGATNKGVTISTWKQCGYDKDNDGDIDVADLKLLTAADAELVLKRYYWDRWKADHINNQSIAEILVDWVWGSGVWGIKIPQRILGVVADGLVGEKTINAVNIHNQENLFDEIKSARFRFVDNIVANNPSQARFIAGWKNRIDFYKFHA